MSDSDPGNRCWFCQEEKPGEIVPLAVTMTKKEADRKREQLVTVPSCPTCNANHKKLARVQTWYTLIGFVFLLAVWAIVIIDMIKTDRFSEIFLIIFVFLFFFIYTSILDKVYIDRMKNRGTQPQNHLNTHPEVESLIEQGWKVGKVKAEE